MFKNCHSTYLIINDIVNFLNGQIVRLIIVKEAFGKQKNLKEVSLYLALCLLTFFMTLFDIWTSMIISTICTATFFSCVNKYRKKFDSCQQILDNSKWEEISNNCCRILQFIKYSKMIQEGYELRMNTNIITQLQLESEEEERKSVQLSQVEKEIHTGIVDIEYRLRNLYELSFYILGLSPHHSWEQKAIQTVPLSYRSCFWLYSEINQFITYLRSYHHHFNIMSQSPFITVFRLVRATDFICIEFKPKLYYIKWKLAEMWKMVDQITKDAIDDELYQALQSKQVSYLEKCYQSLLHLPQYQEQQKQIEEHSQNIFLFADERPLEYSKISQNSENKSLETSKSEERKAFLAKLDTILLIGLARKRAEQMNEDAMIQQEN